MAISEGGSKGLQPCNVSAQLEDPEYSQNTEYLEKGEKHLNVDCFAVNFTCAALAIYSRE